MRLPLLMIFFTYLLLILSDMLIAFDIRAFSRKRANEGKTGIWLKVYGAFAIIILIVLTVAICLPRTRETSGIGAPMWLLYIVLTVLFSQIIYSVFSLLGFIPCIFRAKRWNTGVWIGAPLALIVFAMMWWGAGIGRNRIQTVEVEVLSPKLPESFNGYKIAQISDLHLGTWGNDTAFVSRLVDRVNELHPDLIVFTGDAVNRMAAEYKPFIPVLSRLSAPDGVFSILGNHDYGDYVLWKVPNDKIKNLNTLRNYQKDSDWVLLENTHRFIMRNAADSIALIGVGNWGEPPFSQYGNLKEAYPADSLYDHKFKILLSHNPEHWNQEVSKQSNIDLTLAGHTHAMQIMLEIGPWRWSPSAWKYEQWSGLYTRKDGAGEPISIYVNIGAGEVGLPMRIGATAEITLITLHKSE